MSKVKIEGCIDKVLEATIIYDQMELVNKGHESIDSFILKLMTISEDKRKLPLVVRAKNGMVFSPKIKMLMKDENMFSGEIEKMIITI